MKRKWKGAIGLEAVLKWIFTLLPIGLIALLLWGRLDQQYKNRLGEIHEQARWVQSQAPHFPSETVRRLLIPQLGEYWVRRDDYESGALALRSSESARWYFTLNRRYVLEELVERDRYLLTLGLLGLLASVEVAVFLAYALVRPLRRLCWACTEIAQGRRVELLIPRWFPREIQELARSFNRMSSQLERWRDVQRQVEWMDRLACIGEMASGLSHEIRNPLASMRVRVELLKRQLRGKPESEDVHVLELELDRLNKVVGDLLSFVRPNAPIRTGVQLEEVLYWCRDMVNLQCKRQKVQWVQETSGRRCLPVAADKGQLQQVVLNLVLNAVQAMPDGGVLHVSVECFEDCGVLILADTGPGIPKDIRERIFTPFYTTRKEGTGLGLFIVQRIIDNHRGVISFTSSEQGTEFRVLLPLMKEEQDKPTGAL